MPRQTWLQSIVTRLVAVFVLGSLAMSLSLAMLEVRRAESLLRLEKTNQLAMVARNMRQALEAALPTRSQEDLENLAKLFMTDPVEAVRLRGESAVFTLGTWPDDPALAQAHRWQLNQHNLAAGENVALDRLTIVQTDLLVHGRSMTLQLLVDGPSARWMVRQRIFHMFAWHALFLAGATLLGLLLLRRWLTGPLTGIVALIDHNAPAASFLEFASDQHGEFARLAARLGAMLTSLDHTTNQLRRREQAFEHLYQFAPAALISLDDQHRIVRANHGAAALLATTSIDQLVGRLVTQFVHEDDRPRLARTLGRVAMQREVRCELSLVVAGETIEVVVECAAGDASHGGEAVRLAMVDVTRQKRLERELADQSRLLKLIFDCMSDAILLVDGSGRVAAHNRQLRDLLRRPAEVLRDSVYDPETFWTPLEIVDDDEFVYRLRRIEADMSRSAQERVETRSGVFLFQGIPIHDEAGRPAGRLWVVQETTAQEQRQRLLAQQTRQLDALKRLGSALESVWTTDELLEQACAELWQAVDAQLVGLVIQDPRESAAGRTRQLIHCGAAGCRLIEHGAIVSAVEREILPRVIANNAVTCWQDLTSTPTPGNSHTPGASDQPVVSGPPGARELERAGLGSIAGRPLSGALGPLGAIWLARKAGRPIERSHMHLLEAAGPLIAARLELVQRLTELIEVGLMDPVTHLPTTEMLEMRLSHGVDHGVKVWSLAVLDVRAWVSAMSLTASREGDRILRAVAHDLRSVNRRSTGLARIGPTTFAIVFPGLDAAETTLALGRMTAALRSRGPWANQWESISIGMASVGQDGATPDAVLRAAAARAGIRADWRLGGLIADRRAG